MAIGINPKKRWRYILKADRDRAESEQTHLLLQRLPLQTRIRVLDGVDVGGSGGTGWASRAVSICRHGIAGIDEAHPLRNEDGDVVPFVSPKSSRNGLCPDSVLESLTTNDLTEIAGEIMGDGLEAEDLEKRAPSPEVS